MSTHTRSPSPASVCFPPWRIRRSIVHERLHRERASGHRRADGLDDHGRRPPFSRIPGPGRYPRCSPPAPGSSPAATMFSRWITSHPRRTADRTSPPELDAAPFRAQRPPVHQAHVAPWSQRIRHSKNTSTPAFKSPSPLTVVIRPRAFTLSWHPPEPPAASAPVSTAAVPSPSPNDQVIQASFTGDPLHGLPPDFSRTEWRSKMLPHSRP